MHIAYEKLLERFRAATRLVLPSLFSAKDLEARQIDDMSERMMHLSDENRMLSARIEGALASSEVRAPTEETVSSAKPPRPVAAPAASDSRIYRFPSA